MFSTQHMINTCAIQSPTEYTTPLITIFAKTGFDLRASSQALQLCCGAYLSISKSVHPCNKNPAYHNTIHLKQQIFLSRDRPQFMASQAITNFRIAAYLFLKYKFIVPPLPFFGLAVILLNHESFNVGFSQFHNTKTPISSPSSS